MNKIYTCWFLLSLFIIAGCNERQTFEISNALDEVPLELLDSLVVDVLEPLEMDDYHEGKGLYLMRGKQKSVYLIDEMGRVVAKPDIIGEGPDYVGRSVEGGQFLGDDKIVFMDASSGFHIYDYSFKEKIQVISSMMEKLNTLEIHRNRLPFRSMDKGNKSFLFGIEINSFSYSDINPLQLREGFYEKAKVLFQYDLEAQKVNFLKSYPDEWIPKQAGLWVGTSFPLSEYERTTRLYALLPSIGDQLFVYDNTTDNYALKFTISLSHPERSELNDWVTDGFNNPHYSYPEFNDLRMFGDYQIVKFNSRVPEAVHRELRAGNENYFGSPEWHEALRKYFKPYFIITKEGKQVGIINEFPVPGQMDYVSSEGIIFLNDNRNPSIERDYNVFYKVKMK